jgi:2-polyprenylphenol 6-hydroxylase
VATTEEIVIVGGGPVGLALAIALKHQRLPNVNVTVIERNQSALTTNESSVFDHRVYALSPKSIAFLTDIGAWVHIDHARITPIDAMRVFGDASDEKKNSLAEMIFRQGESLATIVEHRTLMAALIKTVTKHDVNMMAGDAVAASESIVNQNARELTLTSGKKIRADLLIAADGRASPTRAMVGIDVVEKDYLSDALVANFQCEKPHANQAWQWFSPDGVLAYLPLPSIFHGSQTSSQISIVYSTLRENAQHLCALNDDAFADAIAQAGKHTLGQLTLASARDVVPLKRIRANDWVAAGLALVGDAAHAIHPLAGQGVNLGFGDAAALCQVLGERSALSRIGDIALLRRYQRQRAEAAALMGNTTDYLQTLFIRDDRVAKWLRGRGFAWFERASMAKNLASDYAIHA